MARKSEFDYDFVCYVLLRIYLHCTAFRHYCMV